jgi:transposase
MVEYSRKIAERTMGLDWGDKYSHYCVLDREGEEIETGRVATRAGAMEEKFRSMSPTRVVMETGTHSPWVSRLAESCGHEVIVANARKVALIAQNRKKRDKVDAELLARLGRSEPELLYRVRHRGEEAQRGLVLLKSREALVKARTELITHLRGAVKSLGSRLEKCSPECFHQRMVGQLPRGLAGLEASMLEMIGKLTEQIRQLDKAVERLGEDKYPETELLRQVKGVGPLTSLAYVLVLEDAERFERARAVGSYLGLCPALDESGEQSPQLRISKEGDQMLRRLLVSCAQYILGPKGQDSDLRRWGKKLEARGGKHAKKRAVVAVARKLAVVLYVLWSRGEVYEPLRGSGMKSLEAAPAGTV